jgi:hypothetical protein
MLSVPPLLLAARIRFSATTSSESPEVMISRIIQSSTRSDRPSQHNRKMSLCSGGIVLCSISTEASRPTARMITFEVAGPSVPIRSGRSW